MLIAFKKLTESKRDKLLSDGWAFARWLEQRYKALQQRLEHSTALPQRRKEQCDDKLTASHKTMLDRFIARARCALCSTQGVGSQSSISKIEFPR